MKTTPTLTAAEPRSRFGLFGVGEEREIFESLARDVIRHGANGESLQTYVNAVSDDHRQRAVKGLVAKLQSDGPAITVAEYSVLVDFLYFTGRQSLLSQYGLVFPAYDVAADYGFNQAGPWGVATPTSDSTVERWDVLGASIGLPIGIGASPLTANSRWIARWSQSGYNLITYKTVRSQQTDPYARKPNWALLPHVDRPFLPGHEPKTVFGLRGDWVEVGATEFSAANSFGIPSDAPDEWQPDVAKALMVLRENQLLIVSVLGDIYGDVERTPENWATDFVRVSQLAYEAGARVLELNLSCPNLLAGSIVQPPLCDDTDLTTHIVRAVRESLPPDAKLVAKLSPMARLSLRALLQNIGTCIEGVSGVNTLQLPVEMLDVEGGSVDLFPGRHEAGVSGTAIRNLALQFVKDSTEICGELELQLDVIGMGGVTSVESFLELKHAGATAVQSVTGVLANPLLSHDVLARVRADLGSLGPSAAPVDDSEIERHIRALSKNDVQETLERLGEATDLQLVDEVGIRAGRTLAALQELVESGVVETFTRAGQRFFRVS